MLVGKVIDEIVARQARKLSRRQDAFGRRDDLRIRHESHVASNDYGLSRERADGNHSRIIDFGEFLVIGTE